MRVRVVPAELCFVPGKKWHCWYQVLILFKVLRNFCPLWLPVCLALPLCLFLLLSLFVYLSVFFFFFFSLLSLSLCLPVFSPCLSFTVTVCLPIFPFLPVCQPVFLCLFFCCLLSGVHLPVFLCLSGLSVCTSLSV